MKLTKKTDIIKKSDLTDEMKLLLAIIQDEIVDEQFSEYSLDDFDWDHFLYLAIHHRVYPLIYRNIKSINSISIPEHVINTIQSKYKKNVFMMLQLTAEQEIIAKAFAHDEIKSIFLKGPVLAADLYGDISLRTSKDIDIYVQQNDLNKINELLANLGYVKEEHPFILNEKIWRTHHEEYYHLEKNICLEVHWKLHNNFLIEPSFGELWKNRRTSKLSNTPIHILGKEDLFIYLVSHGARHAWARIRWLVDIDKMIRDNSMDWVKIQSIARDLKYRDLLGQSLVLTNILLSTPILKIINADSLIQKKEIKKLVEMALVFIKEYKGTQSFPGDELRKLHYYYTFSMQNNFSQKCKYIRSLLRPTMKDAKVLQLPKQFQFLYFPLRPFFIVGRSLGIIKNE